MSGLSNFEMSSKLVNAYIERDDERHGVRKKDASEVPALARQVLDYFAKEDREIHEYFAKEDQEVPAQPSFTLVGGVTDHTAKNDRASRRDEKATDAQLTPQRCHQAERVRHYFDKAKETMVEDSDDELLDVIQSATEYYEQADRIAAAEEATAQEPHVRAAAEAMKRELGSMSPDPSDPEHAIQEAARALRTKDESISMRAKRMIMGELDLGQYRFKHTDTMLPRKHQNQMTPLLKLFGRGIIVIDVFCGEQRAALGFLAPLSSQSRWVPGDDYIVQTASEIQSGPKQGTVQCEVIARQDLKETDHWQLGKNREHRLNDYPRKHIARLARVTGTTDAFKLMWRTMTLVFIWEREPRDNIGALIKFVEDM